MTTGQGGGDLALKNRRVKMETPLGADKAFVKAAKITEGLSLIYEAQVDWMAPDQKVDLAKVVGRTITVKVNKGEIDGDDWRSFVGTCVEAQFIGLQEGFGYYSLEMRPWIWFLTRTTGNRIFQEINAVDIIKKIFSDRGFSDFTFTVNRTPEKRVYCVQYEETDFDFIARLMEEEGMYFFSTVKDGKDHLMVVDDIGAHSPVENNATIPFYKREAKPQSDKGVAYRRNEDHVFEWRAAEEVTSGKVTLRDYNFEKPKADLTSVKALPKGTHNHKNYELYGYEGRYRETALGDVYARVKMEAEAAKFQEGSGICNVRTMAAGRTFKMEKHERETENKEYLITRAVHWMQIETQQADESQGVKMADQSPRTIKFEEENKDMYRCDFRVIPKATPYRAPLTTPWPKMPGILLAKVTGPSGEEIYTDKYGRIKVQFPWDRDHDFKGDGTGHETSSCWVRVVTPWSGKDWGMVHVPRIGQEVVIMFEDGNIDRPICTGMLYNADTMPPYALPANMTQMGIKTRSTKNGGADNYNELVFEDKKDNEFIRMHAEKDFMLTVENDWIVSVGETKKDPGSVTTTIYKDRTETIKTGDLTLKVETGNENRDIKTNRTEKIGGNAEQKVTGNKTTEVTANMETKVTGTAKTEVTGSTTHKSTGPITIECPATIEIKCGGSSIKLTPASIEIKAPMITTEASGIAQHKGSGMVIVQGGLVLIN